MTAIKKRHAFVVSFVVKIHAGFVNGVRTVNTILAGMEPAEQDRIRNLLSPRILPKLVKTLTCFYVRFLCLMILFPKSRDELRKRGFGYNEAVWRDHVKALRIGFATVELYRKDRERKRNAWLEKRKILQIGYFKDKIQGMAEAAAGYLNFDLYKGRMYRELHQFVEQLDTDRDLFMAAAESLGWGMDEMSLKRAMESEAWHLGKAEEIEPRSLEDTLLDLILKMETETERGTGQYFELFEPRLLRRLRGFRTQLLNTFDDIVSRHGWDLSDEYLKNAEQGEEEVLTEIRAEAA
jgi:hypothetical protein